MPELNNQTLVDAKVLFKLGLIHFQNNRFGSARIFWQQSANAKFERLSLEHLILIPKNLLQFYLHRNKAKKCLSILENSKCSLNPSLGFFE
jgi:hypothetical protein